MDEYPSIPLAYEHVLPSYDWAIQRNDAVEGRLQSVMAYISAVTVTAPGVARLIRPDVDLLSPWLVMAGLLYVVAMGFGIYGRISGQIALVDLAMIHKQWLHKEPSKFQADAVYIAGKNLRRNVELIRRRHGATTGALVLFAAEVFCLLLWIVS